VKVVNYGTVSVCAKKADVCFVLDDSSSIAQQSAGGYDNWDVFIRGFVINITKAFPVAPTLTQFGLVKYSTTATVEWYLNTYGTEATLEAAIQNQQIEGGETDIAGGLRLARTKVLFDSTMGARPDVAKLIILITDGEANFEISDTIPEANASKALGVEIFVVGITSYVNIEQLTAIASSPSSSHFVYATDFKSLNTTLGILLATACQQPSYTSTITTTTTTTPMPITTTTTTTTAPMPTTTSATAMTTPAPTTTTTMIPIQAASPPTTTLPSTIEAPGL